MASSAARLRNDERALCWAHNDHYLDVADLNFLSFLMETINKNFPLWKLLLPMKLQQWVNWSACSMTNDSTTRTRMLRRSFLCDKATSPTCFGLVSFTVYVIMTHFAPTQVATQRWIGGDWCNVKKVDNEACNDALRSFLEMLRAND